MDSKTNEEEKRESIQEIEKVRPPRGRRSKSSSSTVVEEILPNIENEKNESQNNTNESQLEKSQTESKTHRKRKYSRPLIPVDSENMRSHKTEILSNINNRVTKQGRILKECRQNERCSSVVDSFMKNEVYNRRKSAIELSFRRVTSVRFISSSNMPSDESMTPIYGTSRRSLLLMSNTFEEKESNDLFLFEPIFFTRRGYRDPITGSPFKDSASFRRMRSNNF